MLCTNYQHISVYVSNIYICGHFLRQLLLIRFLYCFRWVSLAAQLAPPWQNLQSSDPAARTRQRMHTSEAFVDTLNDIRDFSYIILVPILVSLAHAALILTRHCFAGDAATQCAASCLRRAVVEPLGLRCARWAGWKCRKRISHRSGVARLSTGRGRGWFLCIGSESSDR